jgi:phosphoenolpyruvate---glycerone phosphotransferase subunit DhaL
MAMLATLSYEAIVKRIGCIADQMIAHRDDLAALDAMLGDGDLGRTIERGFKAIQQAAIQDDSAQDIGKLLYRLGSAFADAAASSFGALFGTALIKAGISLTGKSSLTIIDVVNALQIAQESIMARGQAQLGDKTMLDAIAPALIALRDLTNDEITFSSMAEIAAAASTGAAQTKTMQSNIGRASWQGERSIGHIDPGAQAIAWLFTAVFSCSDM